MITYTIICILRFLKEKVHSMQGESGNINKEKEKSKK